jgi:hypothetical protein
LALTTRAPRWVRSTRPKGYQPPRGQLRQGRKCCRRTGQLNARTPKGAEQLVCHLLHHHRIDHLYEPDELATGRPRRGAHMRPDYRVLNPARLGLGHYDRVYIEVTKGRDVTHKLHSIYYVAEQAQMRGESILILLFDFEIITALSEGRISLDKAIRRAARRHVPNPRRPVRSQSFRSAGREAAPRGDRHAYAA